MLWRKGLAAVAAALVVTACGTATGEGPAAVPGPVSAADLAKVTLKVGDQKGGVKSLLTAANLLRGTPYKIEWATFTSGPPLLEAASAGAIDAGRVGNTPPIFAAAAKAKIKVVSVSRSNVEREAVLVPPDSPLRDVASLKGKTIGVAKGSSAHGQLLNTLHNAGLSTKDVKLSFQKASTVKRGSGGGHRSGGSTAGDGDFSNDANFGDASKHGSGGDETLDDQIIEETMMKHYRGLVPCLMQERHRSPGVSEMSVDFVVRGTGKVSAVKVNGQKGGSFANCVLGRMPTFPKYNGNKTIASWSMSMR